MQDFAFWRLLKFKFILDPALKEPKHLPCLELDNGTQFFMTDAASKYLMRDIEEDSDARSQVWSDLI